MAETDRKGKWKKRAPERAKKPAAGAVAPAPVQSVPVAPADANAFLIPADDDWIRDPARGDVDSDDVDGDALPDPDGCAPSTAETEE